MPHAQGASLLPPLPASAAPAADLPPPPRLWQNLGPLLAQAVSCISSYSQQAPLPTQLRASQPCSVLATQLPESTPPPLLLLQQWRCHTAAGLGCPAWPLLLAAAPLALMQRQLPPSPPSLPQSLPLPLPSLLLPLLSLPLPLLLLPLLPLPLPSLPLPLPRPQQQQLLLLATARHLVAADHELTPPTPPLLQQGG